MGEDYSKISKMRIEKHTTVLKFMEVLPYLPEVLKVLNKKESRSGDPAFSLLASIQNSEFLVSLVVLNKIKGISLPFARKLQGKELDLLQALQLIEAVKLSNSEMRNSPDEFPILFKAAQSLANKVGVELTTPRVTGRQMHRTNVPVKSCAEHYKMSVWLPFMDYMISELNARFPVIEIESIGSQATLVPRKMAKTTSSAVQEIKEAAKKYDSDISLAELDGELVVWKKNCELHILKSQDNETTTAAAAVRLAADLPNIRILLQLLRILPITSEQPILPKETQQRTRY